MRITKTTTNASTNSDIAAALINATFQHSDAGGAGSIGNGLKITATNNVASAGTLYGINVSATANTAGATAVGLKVAVNSSSGFAYSALFTGSLVGIGTTSPKGLLDVSGSSASTDSTVFDGTRALSIINTNTTNNNMSGFDFRTNDTTGLLTTGAKIMGVYTSHAAGAVSGDLSFLTRNAGTITEKMRITAAGNVGIGTTTPYARLTVWGPDSASSTLAFNVVNNASTTVFAVFDGGNAQLSGTLTQSSDQRLKTNIQPLSATDTLALIDQLLIR